MLSNLTSYLNAEDIQMDVITIANIPMDVIHEQSQKQPALILLMEEVRGSTHKSDQIQYDGQYEAQSTSEFIFETMESNHLAINGWTFTFVQ